MKGTLVATNPLPDTEQIRTWSGDFGREYTDRNTFTPAQLDELYQRNYGITRSAINRRFLESIPRDARILEVGCNLGNQLLMLQSMGFTSLYGIEIQDYALHRAQGRLPAAVLRQASALAIPYAGRFFDLVFTSGVLIHIAPADLPLALGEIRRSEALDLGFRILCSADDRSGLSRTPRASVEDGLRALVRGTVSRIRVGARRAPALPGKQKCRHRVPAPRQRIKLSARPRNRNLKPRNKNGGA
jgi:SAM-dependent methyltransferase